MLRVVLDTGVFVSALLSPGGPPARVVAAWLEGLYEVVVSPLLLDELADVLRRAKVRDRIGPRGDEFVAFLRRSAALRPDPATSRGIAPDPDDDYLVALVLDERADALVTGDRALLQLEVSGLKVVTPRAFLDAVDAR